MSTPIQTSDVIGWVESRNDPHAFRFEPGVYTSLANPSSVQAAILAHIQTIHNCSASTAKVIYSSSFGKYQIMGFNLYAAPLDIATDFATFMSDSKAQDYIFTVFCAVHHLGATPDELAASAAARINFGSIYNGNGQAYAAQIALSLAHFGYVTVD